MSVNVERHEYSIVNSRDNFELNSRLIVDTYQTIKNPFTNSTVLLGTVNQQHVAVKFSGYDWGPRREWDGLTQINRAEIPAPLALFAIKDEFGRYGIVSEKIDGTNLYKAPSELKIEFGRIIRAMHDRVPIVGKEWRDSGRYDFSYYAKIIEQWRKSPIPEISLGSKSLVLLSELSQAISPHFKSFVPVFTHRDLHNDQVIVTKPKNLYVIDFENWREEHPLDDLAIYLFHTLRTKQSDSDFVNFFKGYIGDNCFTEMDKNIISFYLMLTTIRTIDYHARFVPSGLKSAISNLQQTLTFIHKEKLWKLI